MSETFWYLPANIIGECNSSQGIAGGGDGRKRSAEDASHEETGQARRRTHRIHHVVRHQLIDLETGKMDQKNKPCQLSRQYRQLKVL